MPLRDVVEIDQQLCDGCGDCVTACAEGAIAIIDGKARLVSEVYCDGLGACLGHCPQGAITIVRREAETFDESAVAQLLAGRTSKTGSIPKPAMHVVAQSPISGACPGSRPRVMQPMPLPAAKHGGGASSQLRHWPVQLHLVPATAQFFRGADVLLAADCVAFAIADFHQRYLAGRSLAIACPKLDSQQEIYLHKLVQMIEDAEINSLRVMVMEVPCCSGLVRLAEEAAARANRRIPVAGLIVSTGGRLMDEYRIAG